MEQNYYKSDKEISSKNKTHILVKFILLLKNKKLYYIKINIKLLTSTLFLRKGLWIYGYISNFSLIS